MENATYFNTTNLEGEELKQARKRVNKQERDVLAMFKKLSALNLITPYSMHRLLQSTNPDYRNVPRDSIKRSFTNLKKAGLIEKTGVMVKGDYGRPVNGWRLVK